MTKGSDSSYHPNASISIVQTPKIARMCGTLETNTSSIEEAPDDTVLKTSTPPREFASFRPERLRKFTMQIRISHWKYSPT